MALNYDIIFAGGGATACVTAGRLAAAAPHLKILIIEAGRNTKNMQEHIQPARFFEHLGPTSKTLSFHTGQPSAALGGRIPVVPAAHCVGGGSSVNFSMYTRASASDFDDWEALYENPGWGSKDLIPLAEKLETYHISPGKATHGTSGPISVSFGGHYTNVGQQFLDTAKLYDTTRGLTDDVNDFHTCNAYGKWPKYIDPATGNRCDTAHKYLYNQEGENLTIITDARVKRVLFEGNRATGVEYVQEKIDGVSETPDSERVLVAHSSKLVVVAAGTLGSSAILERSGIGANTLLQSLGIPCVVDLPGVGENYMDHNLVWVPMLAGDEADSLDPIFIGEETEELKSIQSQWSKDGSGLLANNGLDAGIKIRPNETDLQVLGPEFKSRWESFFAGAPDKPVVWHGQMSAFLGDYSTATRRKYFNMGYITFYPASKGYAHITSQDTFAPLKFEPGFLNDNGDLAILRWSYKQVRELGRRMPLFRGEYAPGNPPFKGTSNAKCVERDGPYAISDPDILYSAEDDAAIDEHHRATVATCWHSLGTCAMKPREKAGVVDSSLNVYGTKGLKVADCSICPENVGANTYNTAIIIGEKAATIIAVELGLTL